MSENTIAPAPYRSPIVIPPGATIGEMLEDQLLTQQEFADRMGRPLKTMNQIIKGKKSITSETAQQLERVLGLPVSFWLNLEANYQATKSRLADEAFLRSQAERVNEFPYSEMVKLDLVKDTRNNTERARELLRYLGVASFEAMDSHVRYIALAARKSDVTSLSFAKLAVWLRMAHLQAQQWNLQVFNPEKLHSFIPGIRSLTLAEPSVVITSLREMGEECGVAFLFVHEFKAFPVSGMTRWMAKNPYIITTLRGKSHDRLWFTIFHEIGHVLFHKRQVFIDGIGLTQDEAIEEEADKFARDTLIPEEIFSRLTSGQITISKVRRYAKELGIHPGIVVGRLMKEKFVDYNNTQFR